MFDGLPDPADFASRLMGRFSAEVIGKALAKIGNYSQYQGDPVGFGEQELGEVYTDDVKLMMESVRDNEITIAISSNAVGKTHCASRVAIWFYKAFPDSQVYTGAAPPESNLKKLLWGEIGHVQHRKPELFANDTETMLHIERHAKSFLTGVTIPSSGTEFQREAKFSGKHAPHLLFIIDEGDAVPDEVYRGIESCMSGGHVRLLIMFNPRAEVGEAYRMIRDRRAHVINLSAFNHPNVITGDDIIPGAVTRETTVRRINEWCRPVVDDEPVDELSSFDLPDYLEGVIGRNQSGDPYPPLVAGKYKIMSPGFSYMVLGRYPAQAENQLISKEWILAARGRWDAYVAAKGEVPPDHILGIQGLDVGEFSGDANVAIFRYGGYVERPVVWGGIDLTATGERAATECHTRNVRIVNVDGTGVGAGVAPHMKRLGCFAISVKVASAPTEESELGEFKILRDQLWWSSREWLRIDPMAMLPPDDLLIEDLQTPTYEIKDGKIRVMNKDTMRELLRRSPDRGDAFCMTFYQPTLLFPGL